MVTEPGPSFEIIGSDELLLVLPGLLLTLEPELDPGLLDELLPEPGPPVLELPLVPLELVLPGPLLPVLLPDDEAELPPGVGPSAAVVVSLL